MLTIMIPGSKKIEAGHLVLDYNGTLAVDGKLIPGVKERLATLSKQMTIHVLTADTFGTSPKELSGTNCKLTILRPPFLDEQKKQLITELGKDNVVAIGNGANDALMLQSAALGILVIQEEGASVKALLNAEIVCKSCLDALDLLKNKLRITATLRT